MVLSLLNRRTRMVRIRATLRLYAGAGHRQAPFSSGYRPLFAFLPEMNTSGQVTLLDRPALAPGEEASVELLFGSRDYLGHLRVGSRFTFGEGPGPLGEGEVTQLLDLDSASTPPEKKM